MAMRLAFSKFVYLPVIALSVGAFTVGGSMLFGAFIEKQNHAHLEDLSQRTLERAERAVDYALVSLAELAQMGAVSCTVDSLTQIRRQVYRRGSIKDIRIANSAGRVLCSAYPETLSFDTLRLEESERRKSRNERVSLLRLDQQSGSALGLIWALNEEIHLVAVVNTDALLFDLLPAALRDKSRAFLALDNARVVATYAPGDGVSQLLSKPVHFSASSSRYPLQASIHVDGAALADWNKDAELGVMLTAAALGFIFGLLVSKTVHRRTDPVAELDRGLAAGEFVPYLQPIFRLRDRQIVGCEALARWQRSDGSLGMPYSFIPLAEQSGRIAPLTWQIVAKALQRLAPLMREDKTFTVAFNIAPEHFLSKSFVEEFRDRAKEAKVGTRQIVVELTERQQLQDLAGAADVIGRLRDRGFRVAIDDTGTGHSGLSYIHKLGVNAIKIDKLFVDSIGKDYTAQAVVVMLVKLARELGMTTVAEGIETEEQIALLQQCGVDEGQGYIVAPPLPPDEFLDLVADRRAKAPRSSDRLAAARVA